MSQFSRTYLPKLKPKIDALTHDYDNCLSCHLKLCRTNVVHYRGNLPADVMFVAEAPNESDDILRRPLTGPEGRLLDELCQEVGLVRYLVTTSVACVPLEDGELRSPKPKEIQACNSRLVRLINLCKPKLIVQLGPVSVKAIPPSSRYVIEQLVHPDKILTEYNPYRAETHYKRCVMYLRRWIDAQTNSTKTALSSP